MAAINVQARAFVSMIVNGYDEKYHAGKVKAFPDVFTSPPLKESSLTTYLEQFSNPPMIVLPNLPEDETDNPPRPMTDAELDADVVIAYNDEASTLSDLFALTGMLDAPLQDSKLKQTQERIIGALAQDHLRTKNYVLDPLTSFTHGNAATIAYYTNASAPPPPQYANGKRHFYSQIFQKVYRHSTVENREKIIAQLKEFEPLLQSRSFWYQRGVFKVEGMFYKIIRNDYVKVGVCIAIGAGFYYLTTLKLIPLAVHFFSSNAVTSMSTGIATYMPSAVVQIASGAYTQIVAVVVYVASTRIYVFVTGLGKLGPFVGSPALNYLGHRVWPTSTIAGEIGSYIFAPIFTPARKLGFFMYERAFGPDVRVQMAISKTLANQVKKNEYTYEQAKKHLDEGMKAYQIWMYLVEQGAQEGLFQLS